LKETNVESELAENEKMGRLTNELAEAKAAAAASDALVGVYQMFTAAKVTMKGKRNNTVRNASKGSCVNLFRAAHKRTHSIPTSLFNTMLTHYYTTLSFLSTGALQDD
jgi:hypothetical protein